MTEAERSIRDMSREYTLIYDAIQSTIDRLPRLQKPVQDLIVLLMRLSFTLGKFHTVLEQNEFLSEVDDETNGS